MITENQLGVIIDSLLGCIQFSDYNDNDCCYELTRGKCRVVAFVDDCATLFYDGVAIARYSFKYGRLYLLPFRLACDLDHPKCYDHMIEFQKVSFIQSYICNYFIPFDKQEEQIIMEYKK